jgi:hypothetical protein
MAFKSYPLITSKNFYQENFAKKEFFKTRFENRFINRDPDEVCNPTEFKLEKHQEFARNFISPETPYNGILLFYGTGVGKTCAAMSITEGLKPHISKMNKKTYIIAPESIQRNFMNELYSKKKAKLEIARHSPPGSYQCVGNTYHISPVVVPDEEYRMKKIKANIKKHYEFFGTMEFANYIDIKLKRRQGLSMKAIAEKFADSIIVIDEAHNITGKGKSMKTYKNNDIFIEDELEENDADEDADIIVYEDEDTDGIASDSNTEDDDNANNYDDIAVKTKKKKNEISERSILSVLLDLVRECRKIGRNLKIILLTATPMKDNYTELADLLELLNLNDGIIVDRKKLNPSENTINYEYLISLAKGYISYVRGNDPVSFPKYVRPPESELYQPNPMFYYDTNNTARPDYSIYTDEKKRHKYVFDLYRCPMSIYQFKILIKLKEMIESKKMTDAIYTNSKQLLSFAFPYSHEIYTITNTPEFPLEKHIHKLYGNEGFKNCFNQKIFKYDAVDEDGNLKPKREIVYEYKRDIYEKYGNFLMLENNLKPEFGLETFSTKFAKVIENINSIEGVCFCSNENEEGGAVLLALALESNGFIRYSDKVIYDKNGLPANLSVVKTSHLFSFKAPANNFRCAICGLLYQECIKNKGVIHQFKQATYIIKTGKIKTATDIENMTNIKNKKGHLVKVLIGTKVTNEGIDLKWIRQIHIISPWYNNTKIYQIIGRGIRYCSHIDLEPENRNVCVYKYTSSVPNLVIMPEEISIYDIIQNHNHPAFKKFADFDQVLLLKPKNSAVNQWGLSLGITLRHLLTETTDELIYKMTVLKDVQVKKVERILKTVAVDCELNKNVNYNEHLDIDYSRECEFGPCEYTCIGFQDKNEVPYFEIWLDLIENKVKCPNVFGSEKWQSYLKDKNISALMRIYEHLSLPREFIGINELCAVLINKGASLVKNICKYSVPIITTDISTYNIHFAQPQINKALQYIAQLFQHNIALQETDIIDLVLKKDSLIDKEFIRSALDQLVGNPPISPAREIRDKYNRPGIIIYINSYYVFQPNIFADQKELPLFYKTMPVAFKPEYLSTSNSFSKNLLNKKSQLVDEDNIYKIHEQCINILDMRYSKNEVISELVQIAKIRYLLDFNTIPTQEFFFKQIVSEKYAITTNTRLNFLCKILIEYYLSLNLIIVKSGTIYSFMNPAQMYKFDENKTSSDGHRNWNKWVKIYLEDNDDVVQAYNRKRLVPVNNSSTGIYGFIAESNSKNPRSKVINSYTTNSFNRTIETLERMASYMHSDDNMLDMKFKINDKSNETQITTHYGKPSKKSYKIGLNCLQNATTAAKSMMVKLKLMFSDINAKIEYKNEVITDTLFKGIKTMSECDQIAITLKVLDVIRYKNVRWFLSPFDTEYFIPIKNNIEVMS